MRLRMHNAYISLVFIIFVAFLLLVVLSRTLDVIDGDGDRPNMVVQVETKNKMMHGVDDYILDISEDDGTQYVTVEGIGKIPTHNSSIARIELVRPTNTSALKWRQWFNSTRRHPNIVIFTFDDLGTRIAGMGDTFAFTPNMDRLIQDGIVFDRMYAEKTECAPSRLSFISGRRNDQLRVWGFEPYFRKRNPHLMTFPGLFRRNGYRTISLGKILDNRSYMGELAALDDRCEKYEFDGHCMWDIIERTSLYVDSSICSPNISPLPGDPGWETKIGSIKGKKAPIISRGGEDKDFYDYCLASHAIEYVKRLAKNEEAYRYRPHIRKPFLLMIGFAKPHLPWVAPERYFKRFDFLANSSLADENTKIKIEKAFPIRENVKSFWRQQVGNEGTPLKSEFLPYSNYNNYTRMEKIQAFYATLGMVDEQLGRIVKAIDDSILKNITIIVLWSDHGFHLGDFGDDGYWGKKTLLETTSKIPLVIRPIPWFFIKNKSVKRGTRVKGLAQSVDVFPTLIEMANISMNIEGFENDTLAGTSLVPIIIDPVHGSVREAAVTQYQSIGWYGSYMRYSLRTKRFRYTAYSYFDINMHHDLGNMTANDTVSFKINRVPHMQEEFWDYEKDSLYENRNLVFLEEKAELILEYARKNSSMKVFWKYGDNYVHTWLPKSINDKQTLALKRLRYTFNFKSSTSWKALLHGRPVDNDYLET